MTEPHASMDHTVNQVARNRPDSPKRRELTVEFGSYVSPSQLRAVERLIVVLPGEFVSSRGGGSDIAFERRQWEWLTGVRSWMPTNSEVVLRIGRAGSNVRQAPSSE